MHREPVNAINYDLIEEINDAYRLAADDDSVRSIILTSAFDRAFSGGMDLDMMEGGSGLELRRFLETLYFDMHDLQYRMGKPTIAALTGPARAAGVTLAVSCDVIVGSASASIGYPEIDVGLIPAMHFVHLPRQIGRHKAFELLFTGDPMDAQEAADRGIINHVVPQDEVVETARELAASFNEKSPLVMELARDSYMRSQDLDYRRNIENVVETICNIVETDDAQEGLRAYIEGRKPDW
ncbi:enoyl-CoA hydratase/isomerase family protein [Natrinema caseinilyticum]|uniref:enoyl-CoA hydratase/isomerase family protein n=1 Tax=Natrinema caseinilyticum TaxID=2961570 RepID=UPI0020C5631F|nr:enoyl-CoA hydratase/isomerase family protein [Natrinema caseinilyticum]